MVKNFCNPFKPKYRLHFLGEEHYMLCKHNINWSVFASPPYNAQFGIVGEIVNGKLKKKTYKIE